MTKQVPEIIIAELRSDDLVAAIQIERESGLSSGTIEDYSQKILDPKTILLAAHSSELLVGFFSGRVLVDEFEILNLAVRSDLRRTGIGSALLKTALQKVKNCGLVRGWLEVRSTNYAAINLYQNHSFRHVGYRRNYYHSPPDDAVLMVWENDFQGLSRSL
jgi:[ribosomal protein S18]-alanine N-acetyltransferase